MCKKVKNKNTCNTKIDRCIRPLIKWLLECDYAPVASCCGHNKYPITVVVKKVSPSQVTYFQELFSGEIIPRKKRFYRRDNQGYYYIPEVKGRTR